MEEKMTYGARQGPMTFLRKRIAKVISKDLRIYPVPGSDLLRYHHTESLPDSIQMAATPKEADVLLVMGDLSEPMAEQVAFAYAQMARPRVLVLAGPYRIEPLPPPDVHAELKPDFLPGLISEIRECLNNFAWREDTKPFEPEQLTSKIKEAEQDQGHMHHHHGHGGDGGQDHSTHQHGPGDHGVHDHNHGHDHSGHQHGDHDAQEHNHEHHNHEGHEGHDHSAHKHGESNHPHDHHKEHDHDEHCHDDSHQQAGGRSAHESEADHSHGHDHPHDHGGHEGNDHNHGHDHTGHQHDHAGHNHSHAHGGHDHGGHGSGFMSMIAMTKDLPRSPDGLPMEWSDVQFGPFHPGLPGGLRLAMKLDGDSVAEAKAESDFPPLNLPASVRNNPLLLPDFLEKMNPMTAVSHRLLAQKALENYSGNTAGARLTTVEAAALEKERIVSHLNWLADFALLLGSNWMSNQAIRHFYKFRNNTGDDEALLKFTDRIKNMPYLKIKLSAAGSPVEHDKDHRHHHNHGGHDHNHGHDHSEHKHEGHDHTGHKHDHDSHGGHDHHTGHHHGDNEHHHEEHQHGKSHQSRSGHSAHEPESGDHEHHGGHESHDHSGERVSEPQNLKLEDFSGPVTRAAGFSKDLRTEEAVYQEFGWRPVTTDGNNAWSRLLVRLGEIEQSLRFIAHAETVTGEEASPDVSIPATGMGNGSASIESARGELILKFHIHEGKLAHLKLASSSAAMAALVNPMTKQMELADALIAVSSLDILPQELNY